MLVEYKELSELELTLNYQCQTRRESVKNQCDNSAKWYVKIHAYTYKNNIFTGECDSQWAYFCDEHFNVYLNLTGQRCDNCDSPFGLRSPGMGV